MGTVDICSRTREPDETMTANASGEYLRQAVLTATPEQLHLMLYDGAIRFARQGRAAIEAKDWEQCCEKLLRAQRIILEMKNGLRPDVQPELCERMAQLYDFVYWRLVAANTQHEVKFIDEALQILDHQRETWRLLCDKVRQAQGGAPAAGDASPETRDREESISIRA